MKIVKSSADGEFSSFDNKAIKEALAYLKGDKGINEEDNAPQVDSYKEGDMNDSIRVACLVFCSSPSLGLRCLSLATQV